MELRITLNYYIMSIVDHHGEVEYPFSFKTVFDAVMEAAPQIDKITLDSADEMSGRITFKTGVSLVSWGENIPIQLTKISSTRTKMQILSTPKTGVMFGGAMDFGKNRENIEKIINVVSKVLSEKPKEVETPESPNVSSIADELLKLKKLQEQGILSHHQFEIEKQKVLSNSTAYSTQNTNLSNQHTAQPNQPMVHIEGNGNNSKGYIVLAIIVFIIIFLSSFLSFLPMGY